MKTKIVILIGLALCTMLLVSPALASDTGTLEIYGNANEDDTIDMRDLTYVKLIFFGKKPETELADAKYDGKINPLDFIQIKLIIVGKEKELTFVDCDGKTASVNKPVERIVLHYYSIAEMIRTLGAKERVVGVDDLIMNRPIFFPDLSKREFVGSFLRQEPNIEKILELEPDAIFMGSRKYYASDLENTLKGMDIDVIRLHAFRSEKVIRDINLLGYILDKEENARDFVEWLVKYSDMINERVSEIPEDKKPKVFIDGGSERYSKLVGGQTYGKGSGPDMSVELAGGINIAHDIDVEYIDVEPEWVIFKNPDVIIGRQYFSDYETDDVSEIKAHYDAVFGATGFDKIKAVKDDRVYIIDSIILWGPAYMVGVTYIAKWLYPDVFEDLDPQAVHQEYVDRFQGVDFDVKKFGVFVYP